MVSETLIVTGVIMWIVSLSCLILMFTLSLFYDGKLLDYLLVVSLPFSIVGLLLEITGLFIMC